LQRSGDEISHCKQSAIASSRRTVEGTFRTDWQASKVVSAASSTGARALAAPHDSLAQAAVGGNFDFNHRGLARQAALRTAEGRLRLTTRSTLRFPAISRAPVLRRRRCRGYQCSALALPRSSSRPRFAVAAAWLAGKCPRHFKVTGRPAGAALAQVANSGTGCAAGEHRLVERVVAGALAPACLSVRRTGRPAAGGVAPRVSGEVTAARLGALRKIGRLVVGLRSRHLRS